MGKKKESPAEAAGVAGPAPEPEASDNGKKTSAVGPRDGLKAFNRIKSVLEKLDADVRQSVVDSIVPLGALSDEPAKAADPQAKLF